MNYIVIAFALMAAQPVGAAETNSLTRVGTDVVVRAVHAMSVHPPLLLADENGKTPVLLMEPLQSQAIRDLSPGVTVFRLVSSRDIIHRARFSALVVSTNGNAAHLQTDDEVRHFLNEMADQVKSKSEALRLVRAFAHLRSYRILEAPPDFPNAATPDKQPTPLDTDYRFVAEERKDEWVVYATLFTSDYSGACERYVFTFYKQPGSGLHFDKPVLIRFLRYTL